jgi:hypothetical protein
VARMREERNTYRLLVGKPEGKRPLGRLRRWWVSNVRMDLGEVGRDFSILRIFALHLVGLRFWPTYKITF